MISLYATVTAAQAVALDAGKSRLRNIRLPRRHSPPTKRTVEVSSTLSAPMSKCARSMEIIVHVPDDDLRRCLYPILDAPDDTYVIPRAWLDQAKFRFLKDGEILAECKKHLRARVILSEHTLGYYLKRAIEAGDTKQISPFYIQAVRETMP